MVDPVEPAPVEPVPTPEPVKTGYATELREDGWNLLDYTVEGGQRYVISELFEELAKRKQEAEDSKAQLKSTKIIMIILVVAVILLALTATLLFFKIRDMMDAAYFEEWRRRQSARGRDREARRKPVCPRWAQAQNLVAVVRQDPLVVEGRQDLRAAVVRQDPLVVVVRQDLRAVVVKQDLLVVARQGPPVAVRQDLPVAARQGPQVVVRPGPQAAVSKQDRQEARHVLLNRLPSL